MKRYIIEVSEKGIVKKFIDGKATYKERWIRTESGNMETSGKCITSQLEDSAEAYDDKLIELLDNDDLSGLWTYFEENPDTLKKGKFIKNLATCSNCKLELLSKYESGIWGFSTILKDEKGKFFTKCPMCKNEELYFLDAEDINISPETAVE